MTNRKTNSPEATDPLPLDPSEIQKILRAGVFDVATAPPDLVDDPIQDAWVALLRKRHHLAAVDPLALPDYIRRSVRSTAIDLLRHREAVKRGGNYTTVPVDTLHILQSATPKPERAAIHRQALRRTVRRATGRGPLSRAILELLYLRGLAPEAATTRLGISTATV